MSLVKSKNKICVHSLQLVQLMKVPPQDGTEIGKNRDQMSDGRGISSKL